MPTKQSTGASRPRPPETMQLGCGCKIGYGQLLRTCEPARQLEREILTASTSGQTDQAERAAFTLEEHVAEQLERMEVE